jgi:hypothetical protein
MIATNLALVGTWAGGALLSNLGQVSPPVAGVGSFRVPVSSPWGSVGIRGCSRAAELQPALEHGRTPEQ